MIKTFAELEQRLKVQTSRARMVVVVAHEAHTLEAVFKAMKKGFVEPILIGQAAKIRDLLQEMKVESEALTVMDEADEVRAAQKAVQLIREGKAEFMMKGLIQTGNLLKAVVDKQHGLGMGRIMSHVVFNEIPNYHKLIATSDGGMMMYPNLEQKRAILENAVGVLRKLGYNKPKVAVLAAIEKVNPKMPETVDAHALKAMNQAGEIKNCIVEGPISYDLSMSKQAAEIKNYQSPVSGDADILIVPNITVGNVLGKALIYSAQAKMAGIITGAKAPIILTSRGSSSEEKYLSILLAVAVSH